MGIKKKIQKKSFVLKPLNSKILHFSHMLIFYFKSHCGAAWRLSLPFSFKHKNSCECFKLCV